MLFAYNKHSIHIIMFADKMIIAIVGTTKYYVSHYFIPFMSFFHLFFKSTMTWMRK